MQKDQRDNASDGQASGTEQSRHSTPVRSSPGDLEEDFADEGDTEGCIEDIEWNIFLQGNVMVTLADEDLLQKHNGQLLKLWLHILIGRLWRVL